MCARGSCCCRPAPATSSPARGAGAVLGPVLATVAVLSWRFWTGSRMLPELPTSRPRHLARHVHATLRGLGTCSLAGLLWDWRVTVAALVGTLLAVLVVGLIYRHRTRPTVREPIIYARAYTRPRAPITKARQS